MGCLGVCSHRQYRNCCARLDLDPGYKLLIFPAYAQRAWGIGPARSGHGILVWAASWESDHSLCPRVAPGLHSETHSVKNVCFDDREWIEKKSTVTTIQLWNKWLKDICCQWTLNMSQAIKHQKAVYIDIPIPLENNDLFLINFHILIIIIYFLLVCIYYVLRFDLRLTRI